MANTPLHTLAEVRQTNVGVQASGRCCLPCDTTAVWLQSLSDTAQQRCALATQTTAACTLLAAPSKHTSVQQHCHTAHVAQKSERKTARGNKDTEYCIMGQSGFQNK